MDTTKSIALAAVLVLVSGCATTEERHERQRLAVARRSQNLERWCARRGGVYVSEKVGRIGRSIECRAPANDGERAQMQKLAEDSK